MGVVDSITAAEVENIVAKAVKAAVTVVRQELDKGFNELQDYVRHLEERVASPEAVARPSAPDSAELNELNDKIYAVTRENRRIEVAANEAEQYSRRNNLRIRGLVLQKEEDCRRIVTRFVREKLNVPIVEEDIEVAHTVRWASQAASNAAASNLTQDSSQHATQIVVRFNRRTVRDGVIRQRKLLKNTRVSIVEDLTALNLQLINRLKRTESVDKTWPCRGTGTSTLC